jgi:hypothetical protein
MGPDQKARASPHRPPRFASQPALPRPGPRRLRSPCPCGSLSAELSESVRVACGPPPKPCDVGARSIPILARLTRCRHHTHLVKTRQQPSGVVGHDRDRGSYGGAASPVRVIWPFHPALHPSVRAVLRFVGHQRLYSPRLTHDARNTEELPTANRDKEDVSPPLRGWLPSLTHDHDHHPLRAARSCPGTPATGGPHIARTTGRPHGTEQPPETGTDAAAAPPRTRDDVKWGQARRLNRPHGVESRHPSDE